MALRVALTSAWYEVRQASSGAEALAALREQSADMVIASDTLKDTGLPALIAAITRLDSASHPPPVIALTGRQGDTRLALLEAGAEDVLHRPAQQDHLIARLRSVLRARSAEAEWRLRDMTSRALGLAEPAHLFEHTTPLAVLERAGAPLAPSLARALTERHTVALSHAQMPSALSDLDRPGAPDVVLIALEAGGAPDPGQALARLSDLRAHPVVRAKAILVLVPCGAHDLAARALDLGADDVAMAPAPDLFAEVTHAREIALRAHRLHMRQQMTRSLRNTVRRGAEAALRDTLTGLYNRRYALPYLQRVAQQSEDTGRPFAVMAADLDHFKRINDSHGHAVGDAVLTECARRMQQNMRAVDLVARMGGEEFVIVLPNTTRADARKAARRLCARISERPFAVPGLAAPLRVTVSVGLALSNTQPDLFDMGLRSPEHRIPGEQTALMSLDPERILHRADRALYVAKQDGRNRFSFERPAA